MQVTLLPKDSDLDITNFLFVFVAFFFKEVKKFSASKKKYLIAPKRAGEM